MYFQGVQERGGVSVRDLALLDLFEQVVEEPFYNQLRTKEQLGYSVDAGMRCTHRVLGFCFRIQSAEYAPPHLHQRITVFIKRMQKALVRKGWELGCNI